MSVTHKEKKIQKSETSNISDLFTVHLRMNIALDFRINKADVVEGLVFSYFSRELQSF